MWYYNEKPFTEAPKEYHGFVYCITDLRNGKKYIGKKFFWKPKVLPPLKGKKNKRRSIVESDWQKYYGSNLEVKQLVEEYGPDNFKREILEFCATKGECSYMEAKLQFENDVLLRDDYYNEFIGCKIHSAHIKGLHLNKNNIE